MKLILKAAASAIALAVSSGLHADVLPDTQAQSAWFTDAQSKIAQKLEVNSKFKAKNVILFVILFFKRYAFL